MKMDNKKFINFACQIVKDYYNEYTEILLYDKEIYVVWSCKTLQNNKALISTDIHDGLYFEITYNGDKKEAYLDVYRKQKNIVYNAENI